MIVRPVSVEEKDAYDHVVTHPLQSYAWGEFRAQTGAAVERIGIFDAGKLVSAFTITFHKVPHTSYTVGYVPKSLMPDETMLMALSEIGKRHNSLFIKIEPNVSASLQNPSAHDTIAKFLVSHGCTPGRPLFTRYSFILDISKSEEKLLSGMHQKTRYNVNLAARKGVQIVEDTSRQGLSEYLRLLHDTTKRQQFYAHNDAYFHSMFETLSKHSMIHIFKAMYEGTVLSVWIVFIFGSVLYYPYGASSREHREVMANNLLCWEVIKFGKAKGCTSFDMWGSLGPNPSRLDPWYGFHKFKEGYGGQLVQFVGTYDLVLNPTMYTLFRKVDDLRWGILRLKAKLTR